MRALRIAYLVVGLGLLAAVLYGVDVAAAGAWLGRMGVAGVVSVIAVYGLIFTCDAAAWWLILAGPKLEAAWLGRLWLADTVTFPSNRSGRCIGVIVRNVNTP